MIQIEPIAAFNDNYIWCIYDTSTRATCVVDPGQYEPVRQFLEFHKLNLESIIVTHHHFDHVDGIAKLKEQYHPTVHGPCNPQIQHLDKQYRAGDHVTVLGLTLQVIEVPGHTLDHIAFYHPDIEGSPTLFCGDTLFAGGCGRLFEGTPEVMLQSLQQLAALPEATRAYCAHEYTLANLAFAAAVEPGNNELTERIVRDSSLRDKNIPTVPTTIALEKQTNPFLRSHLATIKQGAERHTGESLNSSADVFAAIREWKNHF